MCRISEKHVLFTVKHQEVGSKGEVQPIVQATPGQVRGVWKSDETLFRVLNTASQTIILGEIQSKSSPNFLIINITFPTSYTVVISFIFSS